MGRFDVGSRPEAEIADAASRYQRAHNLASARGGHNLSSQQFNFGHVVMPTATTNAISQAYDRMPEFSRAALPAYRQMRTEVGRQYDFMTASRARGGMGLNVEVTPGDPYGQDGTYHHVVGELRHDVRENNRVKVLATKTTGGHPFFTNDENDQFRAVHDVFGHLGSGRGVDRHGEEAAFIKHSQMFSPLARAAMASETRGQNSWLHGRGQGEFPEQKVGLLPAPMRNAHFHAGVASVADRLQAMRQNQNQGLA